MKATKLHPKVSSSLAAGSATTFTVWVLSLFGVSMPAEVAAALTALLSLGAGYVTSTDASLEPEAGQTSVMGLLVIVLLVLILLVVTGHLNL